MDTVTCQICLNSFRTLRSHLKTHGYNAFFYRLQYPGAPICSENNLKKQVQSVIESIPRRVHKHQTKDFTCTVCHVVFQKSKYCNRSVHKSICESCKSQKRHYRHYKKNEFLAYLSQDDKGSWSIIDKAEAEKAEGKHLDHWIRKYHFTVAPKKTTKPSKIAKITVSTSEDINKIRAALIKAKKSPDFIQTTAKKLDYSTRTIYRWYQKYWVPTRTLKSVAL